jgi:hypothetical protein
MNVEYKDDDEQKREKGRQAGGVMQDFDECKLDTAIQCIY